MLAGWNGTRGRAKRPEDGSATPENPCCHNALLT